MGLCLIMAPATRGQKASTVANVGQNFPESGG